MIHSKHDSTIHILIIERESIISLELQKELEKNGYMVRCACSVSLALWDAEQSHSSGIKGTLNKPAATGLRNAEQSRWLSIFSVNVGYM